MRTTLLLVIVVIAAFVYCAPVGATLIGDEVVASLEAYGTTWLNNETATVSDPGIEFEVQTSSQLITNDIDIDLSSSQITIVFTLISSSLPVPTPNLASNHLFTLADLNWVDVPTGIIVGLSLVDSNFDLTPTVNNISDHGFDITVSASNDYASDGQDGFVPMSATWDILTRHEMIPEPFSLALVGAGIASLVATQRRIR